jgi:lysophospholipid acyltransferase (LPLAT)-like uncharacterized protein
MTGVSCWKPPEREEEALIMKKIKNEVLFFSLYFFIYILHKTLRYKFVGCEFLKDGPLLVASWHENSLLAITSLSQFENFGVLTSVSSDGELVAQVAKRFGLFSIRGSSSRGGLKALLEVGRALSSEKRIAFAVDGPKGPRREVKPGILFLSEKKQVPIVPMCARANRYFVLKKTWDKFQIPKPFSTVVVSFGPSFVASKDLASESLRLKGCLDNLML